MDSAVSREEFDALKEELEQTRSELREIIRALVRSVELTDEHPWSRALAESLTGGEKASQVFWAIGTCLNKARTGEVPSFSDNLLEWLPTLRDIAETPIESRADIVAVVSKIVGNEADAAVLVNGYEQRGLGREGFAALDDN